jgi:hypothetical protein
MDSILMNNDVIDENGVCILSVNMTSIQTWKQFYIGTIYSRAIEKEKKQKQKKLGTTDDPLVQESQ